MATTARNRGCLPDLGAEAALDPPPPVLGDPAAGDGWARGLKPHDRMYSHHTLASVRRYAFYRPKEGWNAPRDALDFLLESPYDQTEHTFQDRVDTCLQPETYGLETWRKLSNRRAIAAPPGITAVGGRDDEGAIYNKYHPVIIGGLKVKVHPSYVKLMNSSHHSPQTNAGYSRQDCDGNFFNY